MSIPTAPTTARSSSTCRFRALAPIAFGCSSSATAPSTRWRSTCRFKKRDRSARLRRDNLRSGGKLQRFAEIIGARELRIVAIQPDQRLDGAVGTLGDDPNRIAPDGFGANRHESPVRGEFSAGPFRAGFRFGKSGDFRRSFRNERGIALRRAALHPKNHHFNLLLSQRPIVAQIAETLHRAEGRHAPFENGCGDILGARARLLESFEGKRGTAAPVAGNAVTRGEARNFARPSYLRADIVRYRGARQKHQRDQRLHRLMIRRSAASGSTIKAANWRQSRARRAAYSAPSVYVIM